ncbi:MAG TPA: chorismate synthase [Candidatus Krumholzibacteria bacterium]|nr:chorismate synthase [Candidatus Krumholzibacteria bacterium]
MSIRFLTAGDSHGEALLGIVEGIPAGVALNEAVIARELMRRRAAYGRSSRQKIEEDVVRITGGVWNGLTTGAPIGITIPNLARTMQGKTGGGMGTVPRPGHADFAGVMKYSLDDIPPVSERASARSTAMRVAIGAVAKAVLDALAIETIAHVISIGDVTVARGKHSPAEIRRRSTKSPVYCANAAASKRMVTAIQRAKSEGNSLGGSVEVIVTGLFPGIGSHVEWDRRLDGRLAGAMMSIHSVKAVEVGDGFSTHRAHGVDAHDAMSLRDGRVVRATNHAGGIEGGMTNGEDILMRVYAKPIPTAARRAMTFDLATLAATESPYVRSDTCVIPALAVIAEAVAAWEILTATMEKLGGDHIADTMAARDRVVAGIAKRLGAGKRSRAGRKGP